MSAAALGVVPGVPNAKASLQASVEAGTLTLQAQGTQVNVAFVRFSAPASYVIEDDSSPLVAGDGCMVADLGRVMCVGEIGAASLQGAAGDDVVDFFGVPVPVSADGAAGDDGIRVGTEQSRVLGGAGDDQLEGGNGDDRLDGGEGADLLSGGRGSDTLDGAAGTDILEGDSGAQDVLLGGPGNDLLEGGDGSDVMQGGDGADLLAGGSGSDTLAPGEGNDSVVRLRGGDTIQCPVSDLSATTPACADVRVAGGVPDRWPPAADGDASQIEETNAWPALRRQATAILVHIKARAWRWVWRCVRTYDYRDHALRPYKARVRTHEWYRIRHPRPSRRADSARLTSVRGCR